MHKYRWGVNPYDIEKWINDMALQGWHLQKFTWARFTFERGEKGSYIYRHDEIERLATPYEDDYLEFLQAAGIELVDRSGNIVFFRKSASEGPFELYTDKKTKISNLSKKMTLLLSLLLLNLVFGITGLSGDFSGPATDWLGLTVNIANVLIVLLLIIPFFRLVRLRKQLKRDLDVFTD
ncbi:DUF2812 domain-containing protein [Lysinibacillus parviboronicapiens]|uniref:DUF2812 domain-containing protein n=1 Tax=Lysinibacillus parviboronicapiens TaxID=436516 RepID=UPI000D3D0920|nr:DUF2812 domain-containing protein [Lysinibacillus parviboronicapiens]